MGNKMKFEFDWEEVFNGIEKGVVKQISEVNFEEVKSRCERQFKEELTCHTKTSKKEIMEVVKELKNDVKKRLYQEVKQELIDFRKEVIQKQVISEISRYHIDDEVEMIKDRVTNKLLNLAKMSENEKVSLTKEEYNKLLEQSLTLQALEQGGVDNWEWYSESINNFEEENQEYRLLKRRE